MIFTATRLRVSRDGILRAANLLGVPVPRVRSVLKVESAGSGYDKQGRVLILFEPHVFWRCLPAGRRNGALERGLAYPKWGTRKYPADSYIPFKKALEYDAEAACKACSYGLPQILGENYKQAGYPTAQAMFEAFRDKGEDEHLVALARFIRANPQMQAALKRGDYAEFARRYNGPGYAKNQYDTRLAKAEAYYRNDEWRGLAIDAPHPSAVAVGKTQADRARTAQQQATSATGAAPVATAGTAAATPKTTAPWYVTYGPAIGIGIVVAVLAAILIRRAMRSQPTERAPVIELAGA
jgi:hypothetical protein